MTHMILREVKKFEAKEFSNFEAISKKKENWKEHVPPTLTLKASLRFKRMPANSSLVCKMCNRSELIKSN